MEESCQTEKKPLLPGKKKRRRRSKKKPTGLLYGRVLFYVPDFTPIHFGGNFDRRLRLKESTQRLSPLVLRQVDVVHEAVLGGDLILAAHAAHALSQHQQRGYHRVKHSCDPHPLTPHPRRAGPSPLSSGLRTGALPLPPRSLSALAASPGRQRCSCLPRECSASITTATAVATTAAVIVAARGATRWTRLGVREAPRLSECCCITSSVSAVPHLGSSTHRLLSLPGRGTARGSAGSRAGAQPLRHVHLECQQLTNALMRKAELAEAEQHRTTSNSVVQRLPPVR